MKYINTLGEIRTRNLNPYEVSEMALSPIPKTISRVPNEVRRKAERYGITNVETYFRGVLRTGNCIWVWPYGIPENLEEVDYPGTFTYRGNVLTGDEWRKRVVYVETCRACFTVDKLTWDIYDVASPMLKHQSEKEVIRK